jgi:ATP-binding cassette subfamily G (WHITE) protein 2 (SNQ2)
MVAANLMPFFIIMCELFNGILRPPQQMPVFWQYTMYYITPFTYWVGGTMAMILTGRSVVCEADELVDFELPINSTCGTFAEPFLQSTSGYISNPDEGQAGEMCGYCQYSSGEDVSYPVSHAIEHFELTLKPPAVFGEVRAIGIIDLARFWHIPRIRIF